MRNKDTPVIREHKAAMHLTSAIKNLMGSRYQNDISCARNVANLVQRCEQLEDALKLSNTKTAKEKTNAKSTCG